MSGVKAAIEVLHTKNYSCGVVVDAVNRGKSSVAAHIKRKDTTTYFHHEPFEL